MANKVIHCKFCECIFKDEEQYANHIEKKHPEQIIPDMTPRQFVYYLRTGKTHGSCVMCKDDTDWNPSTNKYHRFCKNPKCKEDYREEFKHRMIGKYGKVTLLNDPEQQKKMLAARKISGTYQWSDRLKEHRFTYTGTYEKAFLAFLDLVLNFSPDDIMSPSPHTYGYSYDGKQHFYIPDFFIPSLNLEIEIKDGGDNPNTHPKIQAVDKEKERIKDEVMSSKGVPFNYMKISNKDHMQFMRYLDIAKKNDSEGITNKIVLL